MHQLLRLEEEATKEKVVHKCPPQQLPAEVAGALEVLVGCQVDHMAASLKYLMVEGT